MNVRLTLAAALLLACVSPAQTHATRTMQAATAVRYAATAPAPTLVSTLGTPVQMRVHSCRRENRQTFRCRITVNYSARCEPAVEGCSGLPQLDYQVSVFYRKHGPKKVRSRVTGDPVVAG
jgi:hypothetical protein